MNKKRSLYGLLGLVLLLFVLFFTNDSSSLSGDFEDLSRVDVETENTTKVVSKILGIDDQLEDFVNFDIEEAGRVDEDSYEEDAQEGYRVVKVVDGDTIDVDIDGKVERLRLIGINTPEIVDPRREVECFGKEASEKAKELLLGEFVTLENDETQQDKDRYNRLLRYVILPDGINFNQLMISKGYAYEYTYRDPYKYQKEFVEAENSARELGKGLWSNESCGGKP